MKQLASADLERLAMGAALALALSAGIAWLSQRPLSDLLAPVLLIVGSILAVSSFVRYMGAPAMPFGGPEVPVGFGWYAREAPQLRAPRSKRRAVVGLGIIGFGGVALLAPIPVAIASLALVGGVGVLRAYRFVRYRK